MKNRTSLLLSTLLLLAAPSAALQEPAEPSPFDGAAAAVRDRLEQSLAELDALRQRIQAEQVPLARRLRELQDELKDARAEFNDVDRDASLRALEIQKLQKRIESREEETVYLGGLLSEYARNFESRLGIAELQRYEEPLQAAEDALESRVLPEEEVFRAQLALLEASLGRLEDALGGTRFDGSALDGDGVLSRGTFVVLGPATFFRSADGADVGTVEAVLNSAEPNVIPFADPAQAELLASFVADGRGSLPLDPSLGNAHKIEATQETFLEHVRKGGLVMIPIFALAGAALLVALYKWIRLATLPKPSVKEVERVLDAVRDGDPDRAQQAVAGMRGPIGRMLAAGVEHLSEPRDLIEEVMYETVLKTRLKLNGLLPFVAITAASAPLLGLLGTVTGIINTFKLITVFGSGDVKSLSGGISEALITTEFGLIVAIPALLLHSFLSRKVRAVLGRMETVAVSLVNEVTRARPREAVVVAEPRGAVELEDPEGGPRPGREAPRAASDELRRQVKEVLGDLLGSIVQERRDRELARSRR